MLIVLYVDEILNIIRSHDFIWLDTIFAKLSLLIKYLLLEIFKNLKMALKNLLAPIYSMEKDRKLVMEGNTTDFSNLTVLKIIECIDDKLFFSL